MLKFLKMMVAEDVTITDAAVAVDIVLLQDVKVLVVELFGPSVEGSGGGGFRSDRSSAPREGGFEAIRNLRHQNLHVLVPPPPEPSRLGAELSSSTATAASVMVTSSATIIFRNFNINTTSF